MKHLFSFLLTVLFVLALDSFPMYAQQGITNPNDSIILSYCGSESASQKGSGDKAQVGAAIELPASTMAFYKGNKITAIRFYLNFVSSIDSIKVFVKEELDGDPICLQKFTGHKMLAWNQVNLETPVDINGKRIFVGYYIWSDGYPLSMKTSSMDSALGDWFFIKGNWSHANTIETNYVFALEAVVKGDHLPQYSVSLDQLTVSHYIQADKEYVCEGVITNKGLRTVTGMEITCINPHNGDPQVYSASGLEIPYGKSGTFSFPNFSLSETGDYEVTFKITKINGEEDYDPTDNATTVPILCREKLIQRNALVENITSEACTSCPVSHKALEEACEGLENIVRIEHHAGFFAEELDVFSLAESRQIFEYYSPLYEFAPALILDRTNLKEYGVTPALAGMNETLFSMEYAKASNLKRLINICTEVPAFVTIQLDANYNKETNSIAVDVESEKLDFPLLSEKSYLNVLVIEDSVKAVNQASGGTDYRHRYLIRKFVTPTFGDEIDMSATAKKSYVIKDIPSTWNLKHVSIVAFVSNYDQTNLSNSCVYNAMSVPVVAPDQIKTASGETEIHVYNQGNGILSIEGECNRAEAYTINGMCIGTTNRSILRLNENVQGVVLLKLYQNNGTKTCKIIL